MIGQTRAMLEATPPDGRYRETVIDHSNMYHRSFGHVPIHTAIHPCGKGSNIRIDLYVQAARGISCSSRA